jgi:acyl-CoA thioester hydrolase
MRSLFRAILTIADIVELGLGVAKLGRSSITWRVGVFVKTVGKTQRAPEDPLACAVIDFTHVYCEPVKRRPIEIPKKVREALERILLPEEEVQAKL